MTMIFSLDGNPANFTEVERFDLEPPTASRSKSGDEKIHLFAEQLELPKFENYQPRPRLVQLLKNSLSNVGAVLITGRTGTGKTALAADFAKNYRQTAWYRVESADNNWEIFSSYLYESIFKNKLPRPEENVGVFTEKLFAAVDASADEPKLIVIDGLHNACDTDWFNEFFLTALKALTPETHLIFLSRSKPECPLWRMRSKQVLAVIDEKTLAFDRAETENFCRRHKIKPRQTAKLFDQSYGRIGKLKNLVELNYL